MFDDTATETFILLFVFVFLFAIMMWFTATSETAFIFFGSLSLMSSLFVLTGELILERVI